MPHEPIHYLPVVEQRYARIIEELRNHPARSQWSEADRAKLALGISALANSTDEVEPNDTTIAMAVDLLREVASWLPAAVGFSPHGLISLLQSYVEHS